MGNKIINNFDPKFAAPLDDRIVVADIAARDDLVTDLIAYEGLTVYIKDAGVDLPDIQIYMNTGTVTTPVLGWVSTLASGGISVHNDLSGIQGGISNTEHYHLTEKEAQWVADSVPFIPPTGSINSNEGPTWVYEEIIDQPVVLTGSVVQFEGIDVFARMTDAVGNPLDIEGTDEDVDGWVPVVGSRILTYIFPGVPDPNTTVPVNTGNITGDTAQYKLEVKYKDFNLTSEGFTKQLTYVAASRNTDEIWWTPDGLKLNPIVAVPDLAELQVATEKEALDGLISQLGLDGKFLVYVVSDDLTGGDSSKIQIIQNTKVIYQPGVVANSGWGVEVPYSGSTAASANPGTGFIMIYTTTLQGNDQTYSVVIDGPSLGGA